MFRFLAVSLLLALAAPRALAAERIESFHSHIVVERGGELVVTETIRVRAAGVQIKRGIYRDIPRLQATRFGLKTKKPFEVLSVKRDGKPENYRTSEIGQGGIRIRIGRAEVKLKPGSYTYEITYRTGRQLYLEKKREALYWNVNGTEWEFPTDKVGATVVLPEGIKGTKVWGYTGTLGEQGEDYRAEVTETGATIEATRPFRARENLTVVLEWPPGLLEERAYEEARASIFRDHPLAAWGLLLLAGALVYYLVAWIKVGKDPAKGTIIPLYGPPKGLSASAVRYIDRMGYDDTCFSAGVIGLAAKGVAVIRKSGDTYMLRGTPKPPPPPSGGASPLPGALTTDESRLKRRLLEGNLWLELSDENHVCFGEAREAHRKLLASQARKVHFKLNLGWCIPGLILSMVGTILFLLGIDFFTGLLMGGLGFMGCLVFLVSWRGKEAVVTILVFMIVIAVVVVVAQLGHEDGAPRSLILCMIVYALNLIFIHRMKAPTGLGRWVMDQIEGFRHYLSVAEEERLNLANPPEKTPELFERFLPYALALGCEQQWAEKFDGILQAAVRAPGGSSYSPSYYSGSSGGTSGGVGGMVSDLSGSFTGNLASSAIAPSSGGGAGGGGGSGGGGGGSGGGSGGGGGGGW
ncbi:MAG: DUF2207 domain-containing protein [Roseibacillus sp.]|nr:DUF2207 domain-containing protein [Roseibacillus sp.]